MSTAIEAISQIKSFDELINVLSVLPSLSNVKSIMANTTIAQANMIVGHTVSMAQIASERISRSSVNRYSLFPILDDEMYAMYRLQDTSHWSSDEVDFIKDKGDYDSSSDAEKRLIERINVFFLIGDGAISFSLLRILLECETYEEMLAFTVQLRMEAVHAETYGLAAITMLGEDRFNQVIKQIGESNYISAKIKFIEKYSKADIPKALRHVAQACSEGIFFCVLFATVFWWRSLGKFHNFIYMNELISRDESQHCKLMILRALRAMTDFKVRGDKEVSNDDILQIVMEAVEIEDNFVINELLIEPISDLNKDDMVTYCHSIADNLLVELGLNPYWSVSNPFTWMNDISLQQKANFYEVRSAQYTRSSYRDSINWKNKIVHDDQTTKRYTNPELIDF